MKERKPIIGIIAQGGEPLPKVGFGAVATLLTILIARNEVEHRFDFKVYSTWDERAGELSKSYRHTLFHYFKPRPCFSRLLLAVKRRVYRWMGLDFRECMPNWYLRKVYECVKQDGDLDCLIFEQGGYADGYTAFRNLTGLKLIYHSHLHEEPKRRPLYDEVLVVSHFCSSPWQRVMSKKNVHVLPNSIVLNSFMKNLSKDERQTLRMQWGFSLSDIVVIYVGRILPVKGVRELCQAVTSIVNQNVKLLIVGDLSWRWRELRSSEGYEEVAYKREIMRWVDNSCGRIKVTGYVPNAELWRYYQSADIQAVPSLGEEAAGLVTIEGMASGLPLVVTQSGGMTEYVTSTCAIIVPKDEFVTQHLSKAIEKLASHPEDAVDMAVAGRKRAQEFTEQSYFMHFSNIIERLCKNPSSY